MIFCVICLQTYTSLCHNEYNIPASEPDTKKGKSDSMKKSTRFFALCLALTMCATMAMTGALSEAPTPTAEATAEAGITPVPSESVAPTATPAPDAMVATVNGEIITYEKMRTVYDSLYTSYTSQGYDLTGQEALLESIAIEYAIQEALFNQKAAEMKADQFTKEEEDGFLTEAQATWDSYIEQMAASFLTSQEPTEEEKAAARAQVNDTLAQMDFTAEQAIDELVTSLKYQKTVERMTDLLLSELPAITDEDVQNEYQTRVDADTASFGSDVGNYEYATQYGGQQAFYIPEGMRGITHILLTVDDTLLENYNAILAQLEEGHDDLEATEAGEATVDPSATATPTPVTQADLEAAEAAILESIKETTDAIYARLDSGEDFDALVAEFGTDPGMTQEPNKTEGYSVHSASILYDPAFVAGSFSEQMQKVGDVSQPVVSSFGVHILCYKRDVPGGAVSLTEDLKATLKSEMEMDRQNNALSNAMEEWMAAATIEYANQAAQTPEQ